MPVPQKLCRVIIFILATITVFFVFNKRDNNSENVTVKKKSVFRFSVTHESFVKEFYLKREKWNTSNLGKMLFKKFEPDKSQYRVEETRTYIVLVWKYWDWLLHRHIFGFNTSKLISNGDPLSECSARNCKFFGDEDLLETADAVLVHLQHGLVPKVYERSKNQTWIFLSDESPRNTFSLSANAIKLSGIANIFNWSMTYRTSSDIPVQYGRTLPLKTSFIDGYMKPSDLTRLIPFWEKKQHDVLVTVLMSNCNVPHRMRFLKEIKKNIQVDVYGKCSENDKNTCPGHFKTDCETTSNYLFYLVLENSLCQQYLTEKIWYHAYHKGSIPIIMGPTIEDCEELLPPNSFIHVDKYNSPEELASEIKRISKDQETLLSFHQWRNHFKIVNEHGYFGTSSQHYCRVCEALNYNDKKEKTYDENALRYYLDPALSCS